MQSSDFAGHLEALRGIPKADLHVHLEGTVDHLLLARLAARNGISREAPIVLAGRTIPAPSSKHTSGSFERGSFLEFIRLYVKISECIHSAEDVFLIAKEYIEKAAREGVCHAELYVTPSTLTSLNIAAEELYEGLLASEKHAREKMNFRLRWIFDIVRNSEKSGEDTLRHARAARNAGVDVSAIGVAGLEAGHPALPFQKALQLARAEGFDILIHAGETGGAASIWDALKAGPPSRIGHGISAIEDPRLIEHLIENSIVLEVCPCSNEALLATEVGQHPIVELARSGIPLVLASDDPGIFGKSLLDNYQLAFERGLSAQELGRLARESWRLGQAKSA